MISNFWPSHRLFRHLAKRQVQACQLIENGDTLAEIKAALDMALSLHCPGTAVADDDNDFNKVNV